MNNEYAEALDVARQQVEAGAQVIDVNMDEGLLDSKEAMVTFLNLIAAEPDISRVPIMIDSSKFDVIEARLGCLQGKAMVNSISMKRKASSRSSHKPTVYADHGAAVIVMAFDKHGQADTAQRKIDICSRAFKLLTTRSDSRRRHHLRPNISRSPPASRNTTGTGSNSSRRRPS